VFLSVRYALELEHIPGPFALMIFVTLDLALGCYFVAYSAQWALHFFHCAIGSETFSF
jgi:hypothetical protein